MTDFKIDFSKAKGSKLFKPEDDIGLLDLPKLELFLSPNQYLKIAREHSALIVMVETGLGGNAVNHTTSIPEVSTGLSRVLTSTHCLGYSILITSIDDNYSLEVIQTPQFSEEFIELFGDNIEKLTTELWEQMKLITELEPLNIYTDSDSNHPVVIVEKMGVKSSKKARIEVFGNASYLVIPNKGYTVKIRTSRVDKATILKGGITPDFIRTNFFNFYEINKLLEYLLDNYQ